MIGTERHQRPVWFAHPHRLGASDPSMHLVCICKCALSLMCMCGRLFSRSRSIVIRRHRRVCSQRRWWSDGPRRDTATDRVSYVYYTLALVANPPLPQRSRRLPGTLIHCVSNQTDLLYTRQADVEITIRHLSPSGE